MVEIEIDGERLEAEPGSTVMEAARRIGKQIPHFCYHKKLSIAASCRMCLVEVEKMPKAVPACATQVAPGMKVSTDSEKAGKAQHAVMEFLLANHPLDCPICDQGGECQLQDVAVGYGNGASRYRETKRVVVNKNLGPLINTAMTRCIHCSRCVRFGQEIAGIMELGITGRGEHAEVMAFMGRAVESELSGNVVDLCPVGALTSKPFMYSARAWELNRRRSVSPHDSLGSNLQVQVRRDQVMRVLPEENEAINECWLSDRDRFSYEGLNAADRLTKPQIKQDGQWHEVDWATALDYVQRTLLDIKTEHGGDALAAVVSPQSTLEEMLLVRRLFEQLGSANVESRLRLTDPAFDARRQAIPWLGLPVAALSDLTGVLVVGSFLRKEQPLMAQRLRQAVRRGARLARIGVQGEDWFMAVAAEQRVAPDALPAALAAVLRALAETSGTAVLPEFAAIIAQVQADKAAQAAASALLNGERRAIFLGAWAQQHPQAALIHALAQEIARLSGAVLGVLPEGGNVLGAYLAGAVASGADLWSSPRKAYLVMGCEPELDCADGAAALQALGAAASVVYLGSFAGRAPEYADVMLPVAVFAETSGSFVNAEGCLQSFTATVTPPGETRPAWKLLTALGRMFGFSGFEAESSEAVRDTFLASCGPIGERLGNGLQPSAVDRLPAGTGGLQRVADVPTYSGDALVRRAKSLQKTREAAAPCACLHPATLAAAGLAAGDAVRVRSAAGVVSLPVAADPLLAEGCIRVAAARAETQALGPMSGPLELERA